MSALRLDDSSRVVEDVDLPAEWEHTGDRAAVTSWLGNAGDNDRERIMRHARLIGPRGRALLITFPSVQAFTLGHVSGGLYGITVSRA